MKHRKHSTSHSRSPQKKTSPDKTSTSSTEQQGLTLAEMAAHIAAIRQPYPHLSTNPLSGNSLY